MDSVKQKIEDELFYMLHDRTLDKITVTDLVKKCSVSRQTFYYYFKDVNAVLNSIFKRETENAMGRLISVAGWKKGYESLLEWGDEHRAYILNVLNSVPRKEVEECFRKIMYVYVVREVNRSAEGLEVTAQQREFVADFYAQAFSIHFISWIEKGSSSPETASAMLNVIIKGNLKKTFESFERENKAEAAGKNI